MMARSFVAPRRGGPSRLYTSDAADERLASSAAAVRVAHDEFPRTVRLSAEHLDRPVPHLDRLPRCIDRRALKIGVQDGDIADGDRLDDPAVQERFRLDQSGQYVTNPLAADDRFAGPRHEAGVRFVQRDDRLEIAGIESL